MSHPCPIANCERQAKDGQLMCWPHWKRVPRAINHAVFDTFRNEGVRSEGYRQARAAAIGAVEEKERNET
jgi:hypothetical protein